MKSKLVIRNNRICLLLIFLILFIGLYINIPAKISNEGVNNFDWWSNDIMISDMMYCDNFEVDDSFLYIVTPDKISPTDESKAEGVQPEMFINGQSFDQTVYAQYTSNIVIQRFFYRMLSRYSKNSRSFLLQFLYLFNCALAAFVITAIFYWISDFAKSYSMIVCAIVLVTVCPYFAMYGKNLYWCMYSLFLPTAVMCVVLRKGKLFDNGKRNMILFFASLLSCTVKMLFCFEFVTTVMVGMTIPIFYYCFKNQYKIVQIIKTIIWPFWGAMLSFVLVFGLKCVLLIQQYGESKALEILYNNFGARLWGTVEAGIESIGPISVTSLMLSKEFLSVRGLIPTTFFTMIYISVSIVFVLLISRKIRKAVGVEYRALAYSTALSVLAPLSWFVLAAPHTTIHNQHATINFFIPFGVLVIILIEKTIEIVLTRFRRR